ncbi:unnamed protein product [Gemmata massiliana]|uniref:Uncharacterized protein n=1 Tax=Gemmata massiliana TaxID=1210884 RepID=A0A6P2DGF5_9BACT|nr:hypothetical protein [Gemmata massiliana]VTR99998.1 unnamed protein product [Gemmata massiliana]
MSRLRAWGVAAALAVGTTTATPAIAADNGSATDERPWYKKVFSAPKPTGPTVRSGPVMGGPRPAAPLPPDVVQGAVQAEAEALLRRLTVCTELRQAALEKTPVDEALMRQVDELERQANAIYQTRVAALGVSKNTKAPLPSNSVASFDLAPEKPLDAKAAAAKLVAPAAPVPVSGTAALGGTSAPARPTQEVREVNP